MSRSNRTFVLRLPVAALTAMMAVACPLAARAQQQPSQPAPQQVQPSAEWSKLPRMQIERQFAGPLQDTVIQRLRDPVDGTRPQRHRQHQLHAGHARRGAWPPALTSSQSV